MSGKKKIRVVLDVALTIMIVFEMFIQYTGNFLHEVVGFAFFATVVLHLALSAKWMKNTASAARKGTMTARRTALAVMGILLALTMVVLGVSSVAISGILASAGFTWTLGSYALWASVHAASSYVLCALVVVHLAMHWSFLASAFRVEYDPSRRQAISTGVHAAAAVGAVALGVMAARELMPQTAIAETADEGTNANDNAAFSETVSDTPAASSSAAAPSTGKDSKRDKQSGSSSSASSGSSASASSGSAPSTGSNGSAEGSASGQSQSSAPSTDSSASSTGICTLCRKRCSLSNPKCDKPYQAGLI